MEQINFDGLKISNEKLKERLGVVDNLKDYLSEGEEKPFSVEGGCMKGVVTCNFSSHSQIDNLLQNRKGIDISIRGTELIGIRFGNYDSNGKRLRLNFIQIKNGLKEEILEEDVERTLLIHGIKNEDIFDAIERNITIQNDICNVNTETKDYVENVLEKTLDNLMKVFRQTKINDLYNFLHYLSEDYMGEAISEIDFSAKDIIDLLNKELEKKDLVIGVGGEELTEIKQIQFLSKCLIEENV